MLNQIKNIQMKRVSKQELARARNHINMRLSGHNMVSTLYLLPEECILADRIRADTNELLKMVCKNNITKFGFDIKPRCFCGRVASTVDKHGKIVCFKHSYDNPITIDGIVFNLYKNLPPESSMIGLLYKGVIKSMPTKLQDKIRNIVSKNRYYKYITIYEEA